MNQIIPIFYACDDNFIKYTAVSIRSLIDNADSSRSYHIHILNTTVSQAHMDEILLMQTSNVRISFDDVTQYADKLQGKLPIRDYYTKTTYFRLFIPDMFPEYEKAIYIDSDTVVPGNVAELFDHDLKDNYVGAAHEQVMIQVDTYGTYVERVCGLDRNAYFNAGVLLLNCRLFREKNLLERFVSLLGTYNFVVTQDEDYLNVLCKDRVLWLEQGWNCEVFGDIPCKESDMKIVHYIMVSKPWHYADCRLNHIFWRYAERTPLVDSIREEASSYTDEERVRDNLVCENLLKTAQKEIDREDNYLNRLNQKRAQDRIRVLTKIEQYETAGIFDRDVEEDPPSKELKPEDVEYTPTGLIPRVKTAVAFTAAKIFVRRMMKEKQLIIKDMVGLENLKDLDSGAVITCNHFNAFDSFAIHLAYMASGQKKRKFYRVIREGNYTSFPGFYGFLMRNCNTLPLSSNMRTMCKFIKDVNQLLQEGHFVLFYPEQSMWWNYRKPKPLKNGAFQFSMMSKVPVLPCFITMKDSDILGSDGFYVQEYTIHIGKAIYPDDSMGPRESVESMKKENFRQWQEIYEKEYGIPLRYKTNERGQSQSREA